MNTAESFIILISSHFSPKSLFFQILKMDF